MANETIQAVKISELTKTSTKTSTDLLIINNATGTKAITVDNLLAHEHTNYRDNTTKITENDLDEALKTKVNTVGSGSGDVDLSGYLTTTNAESTYLKKTDASSTYLTKSNANSTYATQASLTSGLNGKANTSHTHSEYASTGVVPTDLSLSGTKLQLKTATGVIGTGITLPTTSGDGTTVTTTTVNGLDGSVTLEAGSNITITKDESNNKLTIASTASGSSGGSGDGLTQEVADTLYRKKTVAITRSDLDSDLQEVVAQVTNAPSNILGYSITNGKAPANKKVSIGIVIPTASFASELVEGATVSASASFKVTNSVTATKVSIQSGLNQHNRCGLIATGGQYDNGNNYSQTYSSGVVVTATPSITWNTANGKDNDYLKFLFTVETDAVGNLVNFKVTNINIQIGSYIVSLDNVSSYNENLNDSSQTDTTFAQLLDAIDVSLVPTRFKGCKWLLLGDSITWYNGHNFSTGVEAGEECVGYQQYVAKAFSIPEVNITNLGASGMTMCTAHTNNLVSNISTVSATGYNLITIALGTNDFGYKANIGTLGEASESSHDNATFIGAYRTVLDTLIASNIDATIVLMTPIQTDTNKKDDVLLKSYVDAIKSIGELYSLPVIDMFSNCGISAVNSSQTLTDGLHPLNKGQEKMGRYLIGALSNI